MSLQACFSGRSATGLLCKPFSLRAQTWRSRYPHPATSSDRRDEAAVSSARHACALIRSSRRAPVAAAQQRPQQPDQDDDEPPRGGGPEEEGRRRRPQRPPQPDDQESDAAQPAQPFSPRVFGPTLALELNLLVRLLVQYPLTRGTAAVLLGYALRLDPFGGLHWNAHDLQLGLQCALPIMALGEHGRVCVCVCFLGEFCDGGSRAKLRRGLHSCLGGLHSCLGWRLQGSGKRAGGR